MLQEIKSLWPSAFPSIKMTVGAQRHIMHKIRSDHEFIYQQFQFVEWAYTLYIKLDHLVDQLIVGAARRDTFKGCTWQLEYPLPEFTRVYCTYLLELIFQKYFSGNFVAPL